MFGMFISPELWAAIHKDVQPIIDRYLEKTRTPLPEPMDDWNRLMDFWDFAYEVDMDVTCDLCGNTTQDWQADDPRKFRLKAANIGGLTCFECLACKARVTKQHFKDKITCFCTPFCDHK
ncbi:hypothetical protein DPF_1167 [Desulfoplanes formicivorans]|uniref:Uncharacterized protein n=2 Tax=Desulfoplanes formicivorans TaxID=1592317 RepID=A0A194AEE7_9BACT|nr:hypothetical protein DPF_1167 [Desulfoplanes formicivorans]